MECRYNIVKIIPSHTEFNCRITREDAGCWLALDGHGEIDISILRGSVLNCSYYYLNIVKLREREGQRVNPGRSLKGHL